MKAMRILNLLLLSVLLLLGTVACSPFGRGDTHLTTEVRRDNTCTLQVELSLPPVSDWLLSGLSKIDTPLEDPSAAAVEVTQTARNSQDYVSVSIHFSDINDLESLVSSANLLQESLPWLRQLLDEVVEDLNIPESVDTTLANLPSPFSYLRVVVDDSSPLLTNYEFEAEVSETTATLLTDVSDVSYHVVLPGIVSSSNADRTEDGALTWSLEGGRTLQMRAESRVVKPSLVAWTGIGGGILVALALIIGIVVYWVKSRSRPNPKPVTPSWEPASAWEDEDDSLWEDDLDSFPLDQEGYEADLPEYGNIDGYDEFGPDPTWNGS